MDSIAVTNSDMGLLSEEQLATFGVLCQSFAMQVLSRSGYEDGMYQRVALEFLEEDSQQSQPANVENVFNIDLSLILETIRKDAKEQKLLKKETETLLERVLTLRQQAEESSLGRQLSFVERYYLLQPQQTRISHQYFSLHTPVHFTAETRNAPLPVVDSTTGSAAGIRMAVQRAGETVRRVGETTQQAREPVVRAAFSPVQDSRNGRQELSGKTDTGLPGEMGSRAVAFAEAARKGSDVFTPRFDEKTRISSAAREQRQPDFWRVNHPAAEMEYRSDGDEARPQQQAADSRVITESIAKAVEKRIVETIRDVSAKETIKNQAVKAPIQKEQPEAAPLKTMTTDLPAQKPQTEPDKTTKTVETGSAAAPVGRAAERVTTVSQADTVYQERESPSPAAKTTRSVQGAYRPSVSAAPDKAAEPQIMTAAEPALDPHGTEGLAFRQKETASDSETHPRMPTPQHQTPTQNSRGIETPFSAALHEKESDSTDVKQETLSDTSGDKSSEEQPAGLYTILKAQETVGRDIRTAIAHTGAEAQDGVVPQGQDAHSRLSLFTGEELSFRTEEEPTAPRASTQPISQDAYLRQIFASGLTEADLPFLTEEQRSRFQGNVAEREKEHSAIQTGEGTKVSDQPEADSLGEHEFGVRKPLEPIQRDIRIMGEGLAPAVRTAAEPAEGQGTVYHQVGAQSEELTFRQEEKAESDAEKHPGTHSPHHHSPAQSSRGMETPFSAVLHEKESDSAAMKQQALSEESGDKFGEEQPASLHTILKAQETVGRDIRTVIAHTGAEVRGEVVPQRQDAHFPLGFFAGEELSFRTEESGSTAPQAFTEEKTRVSLPEQEPLKHDIRMVSDRIGTSGSVRDIRMGAAMPAAQEAASVSRRTVDGAQESRPPKMNDAFPIQGTETTQPISQDAYLQQIFASELTEADLQFLTEEQRSQFQENIVWREKEHSAIQAREGMEVSDQPAANSPGEHESSVRKPLEPTQRDIRIMGEGLAPAARAAAKPAEEQGVGYRQMSAQSEELTFRQEEKAKSDSEKHPGMPSLHHQTSTQSSRGIETPFSAAMHGKESDSTTMKQQDLSELQDMQKAGEAAESRIPTGHSGLRDIRFSAQQGRGKSTERDKAHAPGMREHTTLIPDELAYRTAVPHVERGSRAVGQERVTQLEVMGASEPMHTTGRDIRSVSEPEWGETSPAHLFQRSASELTDADLAFLLGNQDTTQQNTIRHQETVAGQPQASSAPSRMEEQKQTEPAANRSHSLTQSLRLIPGVDIRTIRVLRSSDRRISALSAGQDAENQAASLAMQFIRYGASEPLEMHMNTNAAGTSAVPLPGMPRPAVIPSSESARTQEGVAMPQEELTLAPGFSYQRTQPPAAPAAVNGTEQLQSEYARNLPAWAQDFVRNGSAMGTTAVGIAHSGGITPSVRKIGSLSAPEPRPEEVMDWSAPAAKAASVIPGASPYGKTDMTYKEKTPSEDTVPQSFRMSEGELKRAADQIYHIIEDRIRRERRLLGL